MMWWTVARWVAAGLVVIFIIQMIRDDGARSVRNEIERQNNEAAQNADTAKLSFDDCNPPGRLWNFAAGKCERAP